MPNQDGGAPSSSKQQSVGTFTRPPSEVLISNAIPQFELLKSLLKALGVDKPDQIVKNTLAAYSDLEHGIMYAMADLCCGTHFKNLPKVVRWAITMFFGSIENHSTLEHILIERLGLGCNVALCTTDIRLGYGLRQERKKYKVDISERHTIDIYKIPGRKPQRINMYVSYTLSKPSHSPKHVGRVKVANLEITTCREGAQEIINVYSYPRSTVDIPKITKAKTGKGITWEKTGLSHGIIQERKDCRLHSETDACVVDFISAAYSPVNVFCPTWSLAKSIVCELTGASYDSVSVRGSETSATITQEAVATTENVDPLYKMVKSCTCTILEKNSDGTYYQECTLKLLIEIGVPYEGRTGNCLHGVMFTVTYPDGRYTVFATPKKHKLESNLYAALLADARENVSPKSLQVRGKSDRLDHLPHEMPVTSEEVSYIRGHLPYAIPITSEEVLYILQNASIFESKDGVWCCERCYQWIAGYVQDKQYLEQHFLFPVTGDTSKQVHAYVRYYARVHYVGQESRNMGVRPCESMIRLEDPMLMVRVVPKTFTPQKYDALSWYQKEILEISEYGRFRFYANQVRDLTYNQFSDSILGLHISVVADPPLLPCCDTEIPGGPVLWRGFTILTSEIPLGSASRCAHKPPEYDVVGKEKLFKLYFDKFGSKTAVTFIEKQEGGCAMSPLVELCVKSLCSLDVSYVENCLPVKQCPWSVGYDASSAFITNHRLFVCPISDSEAYVERHILISSRKPWYSTIPSTHLVVRSHFNIESPNKTIVHTQILGRKLANLKEPLLPCGYSAEHRDFSSAGFSRKDNILHELGLRQIFTRKGAEVEGPIPEKVKDAKHPGKGPKKEVAATASSSGDVTAELPPVKGSQDKGKSTKGKGTKGRTVTIIDTRKKEAGATPPGDGVHKPPLPQDSSEEPTTTSDSQEEVESVSSSDGSAHEESPQVSGEGSSEEYPIIDVEEEESLHTLWSPMGEFIPGNKFNKLLQSKKITAILFSCEPQDTAQNIAKHSLSALTEAAIGDRIPEVGIQLTDITYLARKIGGYCSVINTATVCPSSLEHSPFPISLSYDIHSEVSKRGELQFRIKNAKCEIGPRDAESESPTGFSLKEVCIYESRLWNVASKSATVEVSISSSTEELVTKFGPKQGIFRRGCSSVIRALRRFGSWVASIFCYCFPTYRISKLKMQPEEEIPEGFPSYANQVLEQDIEEESLNAQYEIDPEDIESGLWDAVSESIVEEIPPLTKKTIKRFRPKGVFSRCCSPIIGALRGVCSWVASIFRRVLCCLPISRVSKFKAQPEEEVYEGSPSNVGQDLEQLVEEKSSFEVANDVGEAQASDVQSSSPEEEVAKFVVQSVESMDATSVGREEGSGGAVFRP